MPSNPTRCPPGSSARGAYMLPISTGARQAESLNRQIDVSYALLPDATSARLPPMRNRTAIALLALASSMLSMTGGVSCSTEGGSAPASARLTAEGNRRLPYTTTAAGTLYVYDKTAGSVVYTGEVDGGRQILVDPD